MISTRDDRHNNFDLIRLYAACQVVASHSRIHLELPVWGLWRFLGTTPGVPIFFMVSGFLITQSFMSSPSLGRFFWKRAVRIYPLLAINIVVLEGLVLFFGGSNLFSRPSSLLWLTTFILTASDRTAAALSGFSRTMDFTVFYPRYPSGVLWTLSVELTFYLVAGVLLLAVLRWRLVGRIMLAFALVASLWAAMHFGARLHWTFEHFTLPYLWIFGLGVVANLAWKWVAPLFHGTFLLWLVGYVALTELSVLAGYSPELDYKSPDLAVVVRMLVLGGLVLSAAYSWRPLASRILRGNDFSYGIYLWHMLVVATLMGFGMTGHWWLWVVVFGLTLGLAALSWFFIERPAMRLKKIGGSRPYAAASGQI